MTTELDRLPPDQRAVLSLVLDRGKSYTEVARMLAIPESTVRARAHAALDALAGTATGRGIALGAGATGGADQGGAARLGSDKQGAIRHVSGQAGAAHRGSDPAGSGPAGSAPARSIQATARDSQPRGAAGPRTPPSSRTAGALLLGAIVAVIVVAVILITSGGGKGSKAGSTAASSNASSSAGESGSTGSSKSKSTSTSSAGKVAFDKKIVLTPLEPALPGKGEAYVLSQGSRRAFYVAAQGLPPSSSGFFYAVWLYNSPSSSAPLGRAPTVGTDGRMQGGGPLPTNAGLYHEIIVTRETSSHPAHPGPIVLRGTFALH